MYYLVVSCKQIAIHLEIVSAIYVTTSHVLFSHKNLYVVNSAPSFLSGDVKPTNPRNKGISIGNPYEEKIVVGKSSTNAELVQLLREQASWRQAPRGLGGGSLPSIFCSSYVCFFETLLFMLSVNNLLLIDCERLKLFLWRSEFCVPMFCVIFVSNIAVKLFVFIFFLVFNHCK